MDPLSNVANQMKNMLSGADQDFGNERFEFAEASPGNTTEREKYHKLMREKGGKKEEALSID